MKYKKIVNTLTLNMLLLSVFGLGQFVLAQNARKDFNSTRYSKAISEIEAFSQGQITKTIIEDVYYGHYSPSLLTETISLNPPILIVPYSASSGNSITITLSDALATNENIILTVSDDWASTTPETIPRNGTDTEYSFTVDVAENPGFIARWTSIEVKAKIGANSEEVTANLYVLQNPNPDPNYQIIVTPGQQLVDSTAKTVTFSILTAGVPDNLGDPNDYTDDFTVTFNSSQSGWYGYGLNVTPVNDNEFTLSFDLSKNDNDQARVVSIEVSAEFSGSPAYAEVVSLIQQAPDFPPFIFLTPAYQLKDNTAQTVTFLILTSTIPDNDGDDDFTDDFTINFGSTESGWYNNSVSISQENENEYLLSLGVIENTSSMARIVTLDVSADFSGLTLTSSDVRLVQNSPEMPPFIFTTPDYQLTDETNQDVIFKILTSGLPNRDDNEDVDLSDFVFTFSGNESFINTTSIQNLNANETVFTFNISENTSEEARVVGFSLTTKIGGEVATSAGSSIVQQAPDLTPFCIVTPLRQVANYTSQDIIYTAITSALPDKDGDGDVYLDDFNFIFTGDSSWINSIQVINLNPNETTLTFNLKENQGGTDRNLSFILQTEIALTQVNSEEILLVQESNTLSAFLLTSPREQKVPYEGDLFLTFDVKRVNIPEWEVDKTKLPQPPDNWITWNENEPGSGDNILSLKIDSNTNLFSRQEKVIIQGKGDYSGIKDSVDIYQHSGLDSYLVISPREIEVNQDTNTVDYSVLAVNVEDGWEVVTPKKPWIFSAERVDDTILRLKVDTNSLLQSRQGMIKIKGLGNDTLVEDSVKIYQYSALDTLLLIAPRERKIPYFGNNEVKFNVIKVNCAGWDVDLSTLPVGDDSWITLNDSLYPDTVSFTVKPNPDLSSRSHTIYLRASEENSTVFDSVSIYQYSRPDLFLLASPREQKIAHFGNTNVEFDMKRVNIPDWKLIPGTLPDGDWIELNSTASTIDKMVLNVLPNDSDSTRYDTIFVKATTNDTVIDTVAIYQYSALQSYLLLAPRERRVDHRENEINFEVTVVNIEGGWKIAEKPTWIEDLTEDGENTLKLRVTENSDDTSRPGLVVIQGKSPAYQEIKDSVMVYQSAREDSYLLIAPRADTVGYQGDQFLVFEVDTVNAKLQKWVIDTSGSSSWIKNSGSNFYDLLSLEILPNDADTTRKATLKIHLENDAEIYDSVLIYQFGKASSYILTAPREQVVYWNFTGNLPRAFEIEAVNISLLQWKYLDEQDTSWLNSPQIINSQLQFTVKNINNTLKVRQAEVLIFDGTNMEINDTVFIYQKTTFEPYIIPLPPIGDTLPKEIDYSGEAFQINTYSNLDSYVASIPNIDSSWLHLSFPTDKSLLKDSLELTMNDSIWITVDSNDISYPRASTITFTGNGITEKFYLILQEGIRDTVPVKGTINSGDGIDIIEPIVITAGIFSDTMNIGQQNYTVYVDKGWQGTIRPESDRYYFEPPQLLYDTVKGGIVETLNNQDFTAYIIDPKVEFLAYEFEICFGDTMQLVTPNIDYSYPEAKVTGTYGPITYEWKLIGGDNNSISDATILDPDFYPQWNSTYKLIINNSGFKDSATFTVYVNALPTAIDIFNPQTIVCKNQGGVVYQAAEIPDTVFVSWSLSNGGGNFIGDTITNIAVIDWGNDPLITESELYLFTTDVNGCKATEPVIVLIQFNESQESRMPTSVVLKGDNYLTCGDGNAAYYQWGWYEMEKGQIKNHYIIPTQNDWYCQLPEDHIFNTEKYKYFVITYNDAESTSCGTYSFYSIPLGLEELNESNILIYPNPTNGLIHVNFSKLSAERECKLKMYDFSGNLVYQDDKIEIKNSRTIVLNEDNTLSAGLYFIHIQIGNLFYSTKIVVK